jgi:zinc transport system ATP-binding protein
MTTVNRLLSKRGFRKSGSEVDQKEALLLSNVYFSYRGASILRKISLSVSPGECVGIFGPNGGGKTTLLKLLMGFLSPRAGSILIYGEKPEKIRHRIGYVPQAQRTDPYFPITVSELIALGLLSKRPFGGGFSQKEQEASELWMEKLGLLDHKEKAFGELSGGLAQRALLARALIANPEILLLDEPTSNIDHSSLSVVLKTLDDLRGKKTILLVTHDLNSAVQRTDRLACLQGSLSILHPDELCNHFSLGLYHEVLR